MRATFVCEDTFDDIHSGFAKYRDTATGDPWIGIGCSDHNPSNTSSYERIRAGGSPSDMGARLERDVGGRSGGGIAGSFEGAHFRVGTATARRNPRADDPIVANDQAPDGWVLRRHPLVLS